MTQPYDALTFGLASFGAWEHPMKKGQALKARVCPAEVVDE